MKYRLNKFFLILVLFTLNFSFGYSQEFPQKPRNVILLIGNGMGLSHISSGMIKNGGELNMFRLKTIGLIKTHSSDNLIPDSEASGTAIATGAKTYNGAIGVDNDGNAVKSILEIAKEQNKKTGIVVTSSITNATPASFYAHRKSGSKDEQIASDLVASNIDVFVGGGRKYFGKRRDKEDLIFKLRKKKYNIVDDIKGIKSGIFSRKTAALVSNEHLPKSNNRQEYLSQAWLKTFKKLNRNKNGFFMVIESSQIGWASQTNNTDYMLNELLDFDKVVGEIMDFLAVDGETLVIVMANQATGGPVIVEGSLQKKKVKVKWATKKNTPDLVPVFAHGPGSEIFAGVYDNTEIFNKLKYLITDY